MVHRIGGAAVKPLVNKDLFARRIAGTLYSVENLFTFMRKTKAGKAFDNRSLEQLYCQLSITISACNKCIDELTPKVKESNLITVDLPGMEEI